MSQSKKLKKIAGKVAQSEGLKLYWLDYKREGEKWKVSVFLDKKEDQERINFDQLEKVNRKLGPKLDEIIDHSYILEVSSPGVERFLKTDEHFKKAVGQPIQVNTYSPVEGKKRIQGKLKDINNCIKLETEREEVKIPKESIASAKMIVETQGRQEQ